MGSSTVMPSVFKSIKLLRILSFPRHPLGLARTNGIVILSVETGYTATQIWKPNIIHLESPHLNCILGQTNNQFIAGRDIYTQWTIDAAFGAKRTLRQVGKMASITVPAGCESRKKKKKPGIFVFRVTLFDP